VRQQHLQVRGRLHAGPRGRDPATAGTRGGGDAMKRLAEPPTRRFSLRHRRADRAMKGANRPGTARSSRPVVAALVAAFVAAGAVLADTPAAERTAEETPPALSDTDEPGSRPFPDRLTGDWGGLRTALAER